MIVVANKYKLAILDGKFSVEHKKLVRKNMKVSEDYVKTLNNAKESGVFFEVLEKETAEFYKKLEQKEKHQIESREIKRAADTQILSNALSEVITKKTKKTKDEIGN